MTDFNKILKNKLSDYQESPPTQIFDSIKSQYPKQSFTEFLNYNKYYFVAGFAIILVTGILLLNINKEKSTPNNNIEQPESIIANQLENNEYSTVKPKENNANNEIANRQNIETSLIENTLLEKNAQSEKIKISTINIFGMGDTLICGNIYEIMSDKDISCFIVPSNVSLKRNGSKIQFVSNVSGKIQITYSDFNKSINYRDSIIVEYQNSNITEPTFSNTKLCPGESLTIKTNSDYLINWGSTNFELTKKDDKQYMISGLKSGNNRIVIELTDKACSKMFEKNIFLSEQPIIKNVSTPNICSGSNATLRVETNNENSNLFTLNNEISNTNGYFTNLKSGIYTLKIEYDQRCVAHDTLLIMDSLNINPYFVSEKDLIVSNKYYFRNHSKIDDIGFERNRNLEFIWLINGLEVSNLDNIEYEFTKEGNNTIELKAQINENCYKVYSENISISGSNFKIPNIFTPNGDGIGDLFIVTYEGELKNYHLTIVSKMGEVVYETKDIYKHWDGKINGNNDAFEGLYYYIIRGEDKFGSSIEQKGSLQLIRH